MIYGKHAQSLNIHEQIGSSNSENCNSLRNATLTRPGPFCGGLVTVTNSDDLQSLKFLKI